MSPGLSLCSQAAVNLQRPTPRKEGLIFFRCPWAENCMVPPAHGSVVASLHKVTESRVGKSQPTIGSNLTLPCSPGFSALHCFLYLNYDSTLPLFSLSGNFPLCHLVLVLPSPFSFICYPWASNFVVLYDLNWGIRAVTVLKPIPHLDILLSFLVN